MHSYTIHYCYCPTHVFHEATQAFERQASILQIRTLDTKEEHHLFALLTTASSIDIPSHVTPLQVPQRALCPKESDRQKKIEYPLHSILSRKKVAKLILSTEEIASYKRARRHYRRQKNAVLTEKNWRQHTNRRDALKEFQRALTKHQLYSTPFVRTGQYTPYSVAR